MKRTKTQQSIHDKKVKKIAQHWEGQGARVKAHIPGYKNPTKISGSIPDLEISQAGQKRIIEVETPRSIKTAHAKEQRKDFQGWANKSNKRKFYGRVAK